MLQLHGVPGGATLLTLLAGGSALGVPEGATLLTLFQRRSAQGVPRAATLPTLQYSFVGRYPAAPSPKKGIQDSR